MIRVFKVLLVLLLLTNCTGKGRTEPLVLTWDRVDLHSEDETLHRAGSLIYLGGLSLTSRDSRFGGISGLAITADGERLSAVTDKGNWIRLRPAVDRQGWLTGIAAAQIGALRTPDGAPLRKKRDSDAESLTPIHGGFAVSFEHRHRLWLYHGGPNPFLTRPAPFSLPAKARDIHGNKGVETLASLISGELVAIAEDYPADGSYLQGWLYRDGKWRGFRYRRHALFLPTGAATLPGGDLLVLERRFTLMGGFATRLLVLAARAIEPGAVVEGRELLRLERPFITENFEGIAAHGTEDGATILYMISDDNFLAFQRTILLKFLFKP